MLITRLEHQPKGFPFKMYSAGDVLAHVMANQPFYLGCVFAVVRHWHAAGKPALFTDHSFREWVGTLDWIVQEVFKLPPLLLGHECAVERVGNPALSWLRQVAIQVIERGFDGAELSATRLVEISEEAGLSIPGIRAGADEQSYAKTAGRVLAQCFVSKDSIDLDGITVERVARILDDPKHSGREMKLYIFSEAEL